MAGAAQTALAAHARARTAPSAPTCCRSRAALRVRHATSLSAVERRLDRVEHFGAARVTDELWRLSSARFMKRRAGAASRCSTKRGSEREASRRSRPDRSVQPMMSSVPRPGVLGGGADLQRRLARARRAAQAPPHRRRTSAEEITSALVPRSMRKASVQSSTTTTSTTSPGSARASRAPSERPDTPPAHPRPKTGTRIDRRDAIPFPGPTRASRLGVAMPVDDTVTTTSTSRAVDAAPDRAPSRAACTNSSPAPSR